MNAITYRPLSLLTLAAAAMFALPGFAGCNKAAPAASQQPVPKVTVTEVVSQETIDADEYTGQTEASEVVEVRARVFGYLKSIDFKDGDFVTEGHTLFTIEDDTYAAINQQSQSRIDLNKANLELAKTKHARNEKLVKSGAASREDYEESAAAVQAAEAAITAAKADANRTAVDLKYTVITAPISGRIDRAMVTRGNLVTGGVGSGTLLTKIVQEQPMHVYFDVDERSLLRYMRQRAETRTSAPGSLRELGVPCYLQLADEDDFKHEGQLDFASAEVDKGTGTARIRGVFANENRELASGLFVRIRIPVSQPYQALLIPEQALATDQSVKFVYVVGEDGTAQRRTIELGAQRGEMRIVASGLEAGERVIVKGLQRVKPGQKVDAEVVQATAPKTTVHKPAAEVRRAPPPEPSRTKPRPTAAPAEEPAPAESTTSETSAPTSTEVTPAETAAAETSAAKKSVAPPGSETPSPRKRKL
ncbi:MAG TPA: efflux RND transporter periplasmic adaptor subunit [Pirellulaceae bacterium]|nr:efflux RND transporter periplasmic adaptor subunit [Pirellulaceae bacterium]